MNTPVRRRPRTYRAPHQHRPVRIPWGWLIGAPIALYLTAKTWPVQTAIAATLLAAAGITYAVRARNGRAPRLGRGVHIILPRQRRHHRTLAAYQRMDGTQFEHAVADIARRDPHVASATVVGGAEDRALDVLVHLTTGERIAVQCKRYQASKPVPAETVYAVNGTYRDAHRCHRAAIVTTSRFTPSAQAYAQHVGIELVDGSGLTAWADGGHAPWA